MQKLIERKESRIVHIELRKEPLRRIKHLPGTEVGQIPNHVRRTLDILPNDLRCRSGEKVVNLLKGLVSRLWHEQNLIEPPKNGGAFG